MTGKFRGLARRVLPRRLLKSIRSCPNFVAKFKRYLREFPYSHSLIMIWPGSYLAKIPDRYSEHYERYASEGGQMRFSDINKFVKGNSANNADFPRLLALNLVRDQILKEKIIGDVAELGVYKGNTAFLLAELAKKLGSNAYLFDTFEGFHPDDLDGIDKDRDQQFADTSVKAVRSLINLENIRMIEGHFPESTKSLTPNLTFCLVHIDCDLYLPFRAALSYFYPRLVPGGFLIMHDYFGFYWSGVEKAVDEFLADKPERIVPIPDKSGTAVLRKAILQRPTDAGSPRDERVYEGVRVAD